MTGSMKDKFDESFEAFQEQLKELLTTHHTELLEAIRTVPQPPPAPKPDTLTFYETILKVRKHPSPASYDLQPEEPPYFADVFNDVISYFGYDQSSSGDWGPRVMATPQGKRFISEAKKRFAYLTNPDDGKPLFTGKQIIMPRLNGHRIDQMRQQGYETEVILRDRSILYKFTEHDFAVLRQLLEDICEEDIEENKNKSLAELTKPSLGSLAQLASAPKKVISSDLADMLQQKERDT